MNKDMLKSVQLYIKSQVYNIKKDVVLEYAFTFNCCFMTAPSTNWLWS